MDKVYCETCKWLLLKVEGEVVQKACTNPDKGESIEDWYNSRTKWSDPAVNNQNNDCAGFEVRSAIEVAEPVEDTDTNIKDGVIDISEPV